MRAFAVSVLACLGLGACGGGGGGGGNGSDTTPTGPNFANPVIFTANDSISALTYDQPVQFNGTAVTSTVQSDGTPSAFNTPGSAVLTASTGTPSGPDAVQFSKDGRSVVSEGANVDEATILGGTIALEVDRQSQVIFLSDNASTREHNTFAGWATSSGPTGEPVPGDTINFGSFGGETPAADMPTGSATYTGRSAGYAVDSSGSGLYTTSTVTVSTPDFNAVTVNSTGTVGQTTDLGAPPASQPALDFSASGTVSGNGFAGTVSSGSGLSGRVDGTFYGPAADEVGGTFSATGSGATYGGAFGASRTTP